MFCSILALFFSLRVANKSHSSDIISVFLPPSLKTKITDHTKQKIESINERYKFRYDIRFKFLLFQMCFDDSATREKWRLTDRQAPIRNIF